MKKFDDRIYAMLACSAFSALAIGFYHESVLAGFAGALIGYGLSWLVFLAIDR